MWLRRRGFPCRDKHEGAGQAAGVRVTALVPADRCFRERQRPRHPDPGNAGVFAGLCSLVTACLYGELLGTLAGSTPGLPPFCAFFLPLQTWLRCLTVRVITMVMALPRFKCVSGRCP